MPASAMNLQKQFKLIITDGLPQADVEVDGSVHWLRCCPLCGCIHQILGVDEDAPYTPLCQTQPLIYKAQLVIWRKLYPDVARYATLHLKVRKAH